jgi:hypothetical protein
MDDYTTKEVKFVNDPKSLSALAKIHEISNKAKERKQRKSPNHINHIRVNDNMKIDKNKDEPNFARRKSHFPTMVYEGFNILRPQEEKREGMRRSYINNRKPGAKDYKSEFVWDKANNKLVEKKIPLGGLDKIDENDEKLEQKPKNEIKYSNPKNSEKSEIVQKLKEYKKSNNPEIAYGKKVVKESEIEEDDKNIVGTKNTKIYKKVVKDESGEKVFVKKVVEEVTEGIQDEKLVFEDDSDDDDLEKEDEKNPSGNKNMKYQIIKEKYDPQGNKIYSKEIVTNKLPKEYK